MMGDVDVYDEFRKELLETVYLTEETADDVIAFLNDRGVLDYDMLKEIYLYGEDE
jgi:hypothetical protein